MNGCWEGLGSLDEVHGWFYFVGGQIDTCMRFSIRGACCGMINATIT